MLSPLVYIKQQLGMTLSEWSKLDTATQDWYRKAAIEEQEFIASQAK